VIRLIETYWHWYQDGANGLPGMLDEEFETTIEEQEHQI